MSIKKTINTSDWVSQLWWAFKTSDSQLSALWHHTSEGHNSKLYTYILSYSTALNSVVITVHCLVYVWRCIMYFLTIWLPVTVGMNVPIPWLLPSSVQSTLVGILLPLASVTLTLIECNLGSPCLIISVYCACITNTIHYILYNTASQIQHMTNIILRHKYKALK